MVTTFEQLRASVRARVGTAARSWGEFEDDVVLATLIELGMYITNKGEIGDPRPKPASVFSGVRQRESTSVVYRGMPPRRRRGGRR